MASEDLTTGSISRISNEKLGVWDKLKSFGLPQASDYPALPVCPFLRPRKQIAFIVQGSMERKDIDQFECNQFLAVCLGKLPNLFSFLLCKTGVMMSTLPGYYEE